LSKKSFREPLDQRQSATKACVGAVENQRVTHRSGYFKERNVQPVSIRKFKMTAQDELGPSL
jgi:hypothetical protein